MDFQQSRTYANLLSAYQYESQSSTRYDIYSDRARQENLIPVANMFEIAARNDKEHARIWLRRLNNGVIPSTAENLIQAIQEESTVGNEVYREYARVAREEGFDDIAALFNGVANIELNHSLYFTQLYDNLVRNELFCRPEDRLWICYQCGNIMSGLCAPTICPVCFFPQGYYLLYSGAENQS